MNFKYLRYIIIAILLALLTGIIAPILTTYVQTMNIDRRYVYLMVMIIGIIFWAFLGTSIVRYLRQSEQRLISSWHEVLTALISWGLACGVALYKAPAQTWIVVPLTLFGTAILLGSLALFQPINLDHESATDQRNNKRLRWLLTLVTIIGLVLGTLTVNLMAGLLIATTVLLIADPKWPTVLIRYKRQLLQDRLRENGIVVNDWTILNRLPGIKSILLEKSGVLTEPVASIYSVKSVDDRYSDHDVIGIAAGLLRNFASPLSSGFAKYAADQEIDASDVSEPEKIALIGVSGVIHQERFAVISAREALKNYAVSAEVLANYQAIGNSVSYIVDGIQVIGIINYGTPLKYSLLEIDRMLVKRGIRTQIISADAMGSVHGLTEMFQSASYVKAGLSPKDKTLMQMTALQTEDSMFITNQQIPHGMPDRIMMEVGDSLPIVDAQLKDLEQLEVVLKAADKLTYLNQRHLRWLNVGIVFLILMGLLLGVGLGNWIILAPIIAVVIRLVVVAFLMYQMRD